MKKILMLLVIISIFSRVYSQNNNQQELKNDNKPFMSNAMELVVKKDLKATEKIYSINFRIEDYVIKELNLNVIDQNKNIYYFYSDEYIPLNTPKHIGKLGRYYVINKEKTEIYNITDFLTFYSKPNIYRRNFLLKDTVISLKFDKENERSIALHSIKPRKLLNIRVYSDIIGLFDDVPAGILQTEASLHLILNPVPIKNTKALFLHYMDPYFNYAKFRNSYKELRIAHDTNNVMILNSVSMQQYASFQSGLNLNLIELEFPAISSKIDFNGFSDIYVTKVMDSSQVVKDTNTSTIIEYNYRKANFIGGRIGGETSVIIKPFYLLGFEGGVKTYVNWIINTPYDFILENKVEPLGKLNDYLFNGQAQINYAWFLQVYYSGYENTDNMLFFRFSYIGAIHNPKRFISVQLGYKVNLDNLLSKIDNFKTKSK